eukprot:1240025-Prymnesium_polylepis.1
MRAIIWIFSRQPRGRGVRTCNLLFTRDIRAALRRRERAPKRAAARAAWASAVAPDWGGFALGAALATLDEEMLCADARGRGSPCQQSAQGCAPTPSPNPQRRVRW